jgi:hypothetical protein
MKMRAMRKGKLGELTSEVRRWRSQRTRKAEAGMI